MSDSFGEDDLARLLALEHAFLALALISAGNYAFLANIKPSEAVAQFRESIEGSLYDVGDVSAIIRQQMKNHLRRMFDHVAAMAKHADLGA